MDNEPTNRTQQLASAVHAITPPIEVSAHMEPPETRPPMDRGAVPLWIAIRNRRLDRRCA